MIVDLNPPNERKMPRGMHLSHTGKPHFFWTGKVAIGIRYQPRINYVQGDAARLQPHLMLVK